MKTIASAFVRAKRGFGPALKDKANAHFRSKYADLGACIDAVEDALLENGIVFIQETSEDPTGVTVETVFVHESGETMRCGKLHVPAAKQDPQGYGSALTYARRYSLMAACGIAPEDDDGNAARKAAEAAHARRDKDRTEHPARAAWLKKWITAIDTATTVGQMKTCLADAVAEAKSEGDAEAEGQFLAAAATKAAKAKKAEA